MRYCKKCLNKVYHQELDIWYCDKCRAFIAFSDDLTEKELKNTNRTKLIDKMLDEEGRFRSM